jgi:hypothetical protein
MRLYICYVRTKRQCSRQKTSVSQSQSMRDGGVLHSVLLAEGQSFWSYMPQAFPATILMLC